MDEDSVGASGSTLGSLLSGAASLVGAFKSPPKLTEQRVQAPASTAATSNTGLIVGIGAAVLVLIVVIFALKK